MQDRPRNQSEKIYWCKIFQTRHNFVGAFCDKSLLERKLEDDRFKIKVSKQFYGGVLVNEKVAVKIMSKITIGNVIGKDVIEIAKKNGFITEENIILIDGVPHAQFVKL